MSVSVTLRQEKSTIELAGTVYRVVSRITQANPSGMYALFKVLRGESDTDEVYNGVVTLEDFVAYTENPLTRFYDSGANFGAIGAVPGDTLEITNADTERPEWFDSFFEQASFLIGEIPDNQTLFIEGDVQFPTAGTGHDWTIRAPGGAVRGSGTGAVCTRADLSKTTYLRRHWTSLLDDVGTAESRFAAIKAYVESVVNAAQTHGVTFVGVYTEYYE